MLGGILFANTSSSFFPPKKYGSQSIRVTVELVAWSETLVASSRATKILKKVTQAQGCKDNTEGSGTGCRFIMGGV